MDIHGTPLKKKAQKLHVTHEKKKSKSKGSNTGKKKTHWCKSGEGLHDV